MTKVQIKLLPNFKGEIPSYARQGDAGFDIRAAIDEPMFVPYSGRTIIPAGFSMAIPEGHYVQICSRSGFYSKHGVRVGQGVGVIDSGYRGELGVMLTCDFSKGYWVQPGERIGQGILKAFEVANFEVVDELPESERGEGGFGSTGLNEIITPPANLVSEYTGPEIITPSPEALGQVIDGGVLQSDQAAE